MTEQTDAAEVVLLADEILAKADHAFPWPGELDELIADDIAKALIASDWLAAREAAARAEGAAEEWDRWHANSDCVCMDYGPEVMHTNPHRVIARMDGAGS